MSQDSASASAHTTITDQLAKAVQIMITNGEIGYMANCAWLFIGAMGGAPKTDSMRDLMSNLGAALGNYEDLHETISIIEMLKDTIVKRMNSSDATKLACIIIGYNGQVVAPNETDREILLRAGALITAGDRVISAAASASTLPKKPNDAIIVSIKEAVKGFYHARMFELANLVGINLDGIPPYSGESNCGDAHRIAARLEFAVAQWEKM